MSDSRDDELERVLRGTFGRTMNPKLRKPGNPGLGDFDSNLVSVEGQVPGQTYASGPQTQEFGPKGRRSRKMEREWEGVLGGVDRSKCPPWFTEECFDAISRLLEETFRNFQLTARSPSHIAAPFRSVGIDAFPTGGFVTVPSAGTGPVVFTEIVRFKIPETRRRGEIVQVAHSVETASSWAGLEWRILLNGTPIEPYGAFQTELFPWPLTNVGLPHLVSGDTVVFDARSIAGGPHKVLARLFGWHYPVRSELGASVSSTLVD